MFFSAENHPLSSRPIYSPFRPTVSTKSALATTPGREGRVSGAHVASVAPRSSWARSRASKVAPGAWDSSQVRRASGVTLDS